MLVAQEDKTSVWDVEYDGTFSGTWRIVARTAVVRRRLDSSTARPVYLATVYDKEVADAIAKAHNDALCTVPISIQVRSPHCARNCMTCKWRREDPNEVCKSCEELDCWEPSKEIHGVDE